MAGATADGDGLNRGTAAVRHVGRRLLVRRDGVWTDVELDPRLEVVEVAPFSDAYFELVSELPALRPYLALGDALIIAGDGLALKIDASGQTTLGRTQIRRIVDAIEGTL